MSQKKSRKGRPPKKAAEKLVQFKVSLPQDAIQYLGERAQDLTAAAGTAGYARMLLLDAIERDKLLVGGGNWPMPKAQKVTTGGKS